jgi:23S rRNA pseudouridine1911/1915/1917 synthase
MQPIQHIAVIPLEYSGLRFDQVAALLFADFSRAQLQHWIKDGSLQVDGITARAKDKVRALGGARLGA